MNLSQVQVDFQQEAPPDLEPQLRSEEARVVRILAAVQELQSSKAWSTLKIEVFDSLVNVLEKDLKNEAKKVDADPKKLNRIAGELKWAEKYSDLQKFENDYKVQLQNVRFKLHGKTQE